MPLVFVEVLLAGPLDVDVVDEGFVRVREDEDAGLDLDVDRITFSVSTSVSPTATDWPRFRLPVVASELDPADVGCVSGARVREDRRGGITGAGRTSSSSSLRETLIDSHANCHTSRDLVTSH